jgi:hypothetical protein
VHFKARKKGGMSEDGTTAGEDVERKIEKVKELMKDWN